MEMYNEQVVNHYIDRSNFCGNKYHFLPRTGLRGRRAVSLRICLVVKPHSDACALCAALH